MDEAGPYMAPPEGGGELVNEDTGIVRRVPLGPGRPEGLRPAAGSEGDSGSSSSSDSDDSGRRRRRRSGGTKSERREKKSKRRKKEKKEKERRREKKRRRGLSTGNS